MTLSVILIKGKEHPKPPSWLLPCKEHSSKSVHACVCVCVCVCPLNSPARWRWWRPRAGRVRPLSGRAVGHHLARSGPHQQRDEELCRPAETVSLTPPFNNAYFFTLGQKRVVLSISCGEISLSTLEHLELFLWSCELIPDIYPITCLGLYPVSYLNPSQT